MLSLAQAAFNDIAKFQEIVNPTMKTMFEAPASKIDELEEKVMNHIEKEIENMESDQPKWRIALYMKDLFPLLLEQKAITYFILETQYIELRGALPEILSAEEAILLLRNEIPDLTEKDKNLIKEILNHPNKYLPNL